MKSGIVLAGGKGSRLGADKGLMKFEGKPLLSWTLDAMKKIVDEIFLSVSSKADISKYQHFKDKTITFVTDMFSNMGPISGVYSAMKVSRSAYVAVAPCDSPFIRFELYDLLFKEAIGFDGAVPYINGYWEPLQGVYRRDALMEGIDRTLETGRRRIVDAYAHMDIRKVREDKIVTVDPKLSSFININTMKDLKRAKMLFEGKE